MKRWLVLALLIPLAACRAGEEPAAPEVIDAGNLPVVVCSGGAA